MPNLVGLLFWKGVIVFGISNYENVRRGTSYPCLVIIFTLIDYERSNIYGQLRKVESVIHVTSIDKLGRMARASREFHVKYIELPRGPVS